MVLISIKTYGGRYWPLDDDIKLDEPVINLKRSVEKTLGIHHTHQELFFKEQFLHDDVKLTEYGITENSVINLKIGLIR